MSETTTTPHDAATVIEEALRQDTLCGAFQGWLFKKTTLYERLMLLVAGVLLVYPKPLFDIAGFALVALVLATQFLVKRQEIPRAAA